MPIASTYGIAISSAEDGSAISLETCGDQIQIVRPGPGEDYLAVTNHYVHPQMQRGEVTVSPGRIMNTEARYDWLREQAARGGLDLEQTQRLLSSHEEPGGAGHSRACGGVVSQVHTVQSVVVAPSSRQLHVSVGPVPTGDGPWLAIPWRWSETPGYEVLEGDGSSLPVTVDLTFGQPSKLTGRKALLEASAIQWQSGSKAGSTRWLEQAVEADPDAPSYRLLLGGARLQEGRWADALSEFSLGIEQERNDFYRGQLMFWAIRAAQQLGRDEEAAGWRKQLERCASPLLGSYRALAAREATKPLKGRKLKKVTLNYHLCDLHLPV